MPGLPSDLVAGLRSELGHDGVLDDPDLMAPHLIDWMRRYPGEAVAIVRPTTAGQVAAVIRHCRRAGAAVVPQGGNTGLVGGAVGTRGSVILSTSRLTTIEPVDGAASQITVAAGVTLADTHRAAAAAGLRFPVDLAARGTATIGGMVATNAGGLAVLRYGTMRALLAGIEAVLPDGSVISHLGGLAKDNTGFDLAGLLCGSEGTLGVITRVRLKLVPPDGARRTLALALRSVAAGLAALRSLREAGIVVESAEVVRRAGVELVERHLGVVAPVALHAPFALLLELVDTDRLDTALEALLAAVPDVLDAAVAGSASQADALWQWRERHTESISARGVPVKLDVSLPPAELERFVEDVDAIVRDARPSAEVHVFGHLGDGNLHVNVLGLDVADPDAVDAVEGAVLRRVAAVGGSISAEHGIGRMKARWLHLSRSDAEIAAMRSIKAALDPEGIMNPGVLLGVTPTLP